MRTLARAAASSTRERQVVEPAAELRDVVRRARAFARAAEELDGLRLGERRHRILDLALDAEELPARDEEVKVRARGQEADSSGAAATTCSKLSRSRSSSCRPMCSASDRPAPSACAMVVRHEHGVAQRRERNPDDGITKVRHELGGDLDREPCLARATGAGQRHEARAVANELERSRRPPARGRRTSSPGSGRFVFESVFSGGKSRVTELVDRDRERDVLEAVLAELDESSARRARESPARATTWPPCAGGGDARAQVDVVAHVALVGEQRRARVQADPHLDRPRRQRLGHRVGSSDRSRRRRERRRRTRRPACRPRRRPRQRRPRGSAGGARPEPRRTPRPELVQQLRRPLDVREEEGDRAGGKVVTHRRADHRAYGDAPSSEARSAMADIGVFDRVPVDIARPADTARCRSVLAQCRPQAAATVPRGVQPPRR